MISYHLASTLKTDAQSAQGITLPVRLALTSAIQIDAQAAAAWIYGEDNSVQVSTHWQTKAEISYFIRAGATYAEGQSVSAYRVWGVPYVQLYPYRKHHLAYSERDRTQYQYDVNFDYYDQGEQVNRYTPITTFTFNPHEDNPTPRPSFQAPLNPAFTLMGDSYTPSTAIHLTYWDGFSFIQRPIVETLPFNYLFYGSFVVKSNRLYTIKGVLASARSSVFRNTSPRSVRKCYREGHTIRPTNGVSIITPYIDTRPPVNPRPSTHIIVTIPTQTHYTMSHTLTTALLDGTALDLENFSIACDLDSYAWNFNATLLNPEQMSRLLPDANGNPAQVVITLDGLTWKFIIEKIAKTKTFGKSAITLTGRSLSALLGAPYIDPATASYGTLLNISQIADMQMPTGFTLTWNAPDWGVAAGAYDYVNKNPMQVISEMAASTGLSVIPSENTKAITVAKRYPYYPWEFDAVDPDFIIPESILSSVSFRPQVASNVNGVYVYGGQAGGITAWCKLQGTAGEVLAQSQSCNLLTDVVGCRTLGSRILAAYAPQPVIQSATFGLDNITYPYIPLGSLVSITADGVTCRGIVNSVSIAVAFGSVAQTITIGEETPNAWSVFRSLLPANPLMIGTVSAVQGSSSIMTLVGGGVMRVRGIGNVGSKYYIRSGALESEAPNLQTYQLEI